ncbi:hypothetical protein OG558_23800 [Kribbella sp. NBC_01510]|uniref:hypothetical protein n=1 Tax=Kribbella sp. NBC_01510 TaxID=2903581 RepID=UPI003864A49B
MQSESSDQGRTSRDGEPAPNAPRRAWALGVITVAELLLLLGALVPLIGATNALERSKATDVSYLWWSGAPTQPMVFVMVSAVGGALGGALHGIASLTSHVCDRSFDAVWTMWYLANPVVGASLATAFLFVLQGGLGGQVATSAGGLYGVAAVATLSGLFSRHALAKLKDIFDIAVGAKEAVERDRGQQTRGSTAVRSDPPPASAPGNTPGDSR